MMLCEYTCYDVMLTQPYCDQVSDYGITAVEYVALLTPLRLLVIFSMYQIME